MTTKKSAEKAEYIDLKCKLYWWRHATPDDYDKYGGVAAGLSDRAVAKLEELGFGDRIEADEDKPELGRYIGIRSRFPVPTTYEDEELGEKDRVGNGSSAIVTVKPRAWTYQKKSGLALDPVAAKITELVVPAQTAREAF